MSWKYYRKQTELSSDRVYEVLRSPVISEKAMRSLEDGQVTFKVAIDATKPEIKAAIEKLYNVNVRTVNTIRQKGKAVRFRNRPGRRSGYKKAVVRLEEGQSIDVTTGL